MSYNGSNVEKHKRVSDMKKKTNYNTKDYWHASQRAEHWSYLANMAAERGDKALEQRHLARCQKWLDVMTKLEGRGE